MFLGVFGVADHEFDIIFEKFRRNAENKPKREVTEIKKLKILKKIEK